MKIDVVSKQKCTGCGACVSNCPKQCISMARDNLDNVYPVIDSDACVECGLCLDNCPAEKPVKKNQPIKAYAGWNCDRKIRSSGASGGMASGIYSFFQSKGYICYGVESDKGKSFFSKAGINEDASLKFRNSKYVYTQVGEVIGDLASELKSGHKVCCIGLPCQIAAIRKSFEKRFSDSLFLVDIICHGVSSDEYLKQHIASKSHGRVVQKVMFRNPLFDTEKFHFTLEDDKGVFYDKTPNQPDEYQLGYHKGIIYRDNCYNCNYACANRVGDVTIADYWGLGKTIPFEYDKANVNLVYACTDKGLNELIEMVKAGYVDLVERPVEESLKTQGQLNKPTPVTVRRKRFKKYYSETHDFDRAVFKAMYWDMKFIGRDAYTKINTIRKIVKKLFKVGI